jgi:hypothetical protein
LDQLSRWLRALPDTAARTERRLADLHTIAFDREVGEQIGGRSRKVGWALTDVGKRQAKDLWTKHARAVRNVIAEFESLERDLRQLLNAGPMADNTLRGTMLGDDLCRCGHAADKHEPHCTSPTGPTVEYASKTDTPKTLTPTCECKRYNPISASEELAALVNGQTERSARGDYVPNREMAQPKVPRR